MRDQPEAVEEMVEELQARGAIPLAIEKNRLAKELGAVVTCYGPGDDT